MDFKQVVLRMDGAVCRECRHRLERGQTVIQGYERDKSGLWTKEFCDEICLSQWRGKRMSLKDKMLNRLTVKFN